MAAGRSLRDALKEELSALTTIARRLCPLAIILEVATTRGYDDLFEALQNTPEPRSREHNSQED
jgi:hypothetical protein